MLSTVELPVLPCLSAPLFMAMNSMGWKLSAAFSPVDDSSGLKGCLICIPVINSFGMLQHSRYSPDGRDLNRSFPGSERGSLTARLCHIFLEQVVKKCDYGIDLHTGAQHRSNLPQIRGNLDDEQIAELASSFGVPVLLNANERDGSLRQVATRTMSKCCFMKPVRPCGTMKCQSRWALQVF